MIDAVLFDWGGTLDDGAWSDEIALNANRAGLAAIGRQDIDPQLINDWFERNEDAFRLDSTDEINLVEITRAYLDAVGCVVTGGELEAYMVAWQVVASGEVRLHPDVRRLLAGLRSRGLRIGLISNTFAPGRLLTPRLEKDGIGEAIDVIVFSSEYGKRKPHPAIFEAALEELGVSPERALFVGDQPVADIMGAKGVGMKTVLALWFRNDEPDHDADFVAREPLEVFDILDRCQSAIPS